MYAQFLLSQMHNGALFGTSIMLLILGMCYSQPVPAMFIFRDSIVDPGNNNYINTTAIGSVFPYGIDFGCTTGRFTNGKTVVDIIGKKLGFKNYFPPYLAPTTVWPLILKGVNYASAGGGILNDTGAIFGGRLCMGAQLDYFANTRREIISNIGATTALELLQNSLYWVIMGANDFLDNYLKPHSFPPALDQNIIGASFFVGSMISRFRVQLTRLYNLGARKIVVLNVGPIGCIPYERVSYAIARDTCVEFPNQVAQLFNVNLRSLVNELSSTLTGSKFLHANSYGIIQDIIQNYISYGFSNANTSCCRPFRIFGYQIPCGPTSEVCPDRSKYVFWDVFHNSEAANSIFAERLLRGNRWEISPMNIWQLVQS